MYQVDELVTNFPDAPLSVKLIEWYNWLYSQLGEYESFEPCPLDELVESEEDLTEVLSNLVYGNFDDAVIGWLVDQLVPLGNQQANALLNDLTQRVRAEL